MVSLDGNTYESSTGGVVASQVIEVREVQNSKALFPMLVTLFGIVIEVREEQPWNAESPMLVTLSGIVTEVRDSQ